FIAGAGAEVRHHAAFPDHARWSGSSLAAALSRARLKGAELALITEKDEPRWPGHLEAALPVRVIRTRVLPLDPVEDALRAIRGGAPGHGAAAGRAEAEAGKR
ncbi:MAG TPA: hypothetical protein VN972_02395, partial [Methylomirabilota bacterium]|nr:hypothetical protein [Methylomirabilota bacterium]